MASAKKMGSPHRAVRRCSGTCPLFRFENRTGHENPRMVRAGHWKTPCTILYSAIRAPILIGHGKRDELVPFEMGKELHREAREPKRFVEFRGGHADGFSQSPEAGVK